MKIKIKKSKIIASHVNPKDARIKLTLYNGEDYIDLYISNQGKIQYLKYDQITEQVANLLDCGVAWPDDETMVIGDLKEIVETFTPEDIDVLLISNVEIELAEQQPSPDVAIFPGNYLHSLQSWKVREMRKDFIC